MNEPSPASRPVASVTVLDHPLVQHKLTRLRQVTTSTAGFRRLTRELALLMAYEATRTSSSSRSRSRPRSSR